MSVMCPICSWKGNDFLPFGVHTRNNVKCPNCSSKERHRLLYLFFKKFIKKNKKYDFLHIAPESCLIEFFKNQPNINYRSIDINPEKRNAMRKEDLIKLSFSDNSFDLIYCSHVLEHIKEDIKAMREIYRILRKGGTAILQVPLFDIEKTIEDKNYSEEKKIELFGQKDHVRAYGKDYVDRITSVGFKVNINRFIDKFSNKQKKWFGLMHDVRTTPFRLAEQENIFECTK